MEQVTGDKVPDFDTLVSCTRHEIAAAEGMEEVTIQANTETYPYECVEICRITVVKSYPSTVSAARAVTATL